MAKPRPSAKPRPLTVRQSRFVAGILGGQTGTAAAVSAGFSVRNAKHSAHRLMQVPAVRTAVAEARARILATGEYDAATAAERLLGHIEAAAAKGNSMAVMKGEELLMRLKGMLVERAQIEVASIDVSGILARLRALHASPAIAGEHRRIEPPALAAESDPASV